MILRLRKLSFPKEYVKKREVAESNELVKTFIIEITPPTTL